MPLKNNVIGSYILLRMTSNQPKFFCDEMLARLGRWLRAAGHDTLIASPATKDSVILEESLREKRILLTRDRLFLPHPDVIILNANTVRDCIHELNHKIKLNWLYRPFSRCMLCNHELKETLENEFIQQIPPDIRQQVTRIWYCEFCKKVFWEGSHTKRMLKQLKQWQVT